MTIIKIPSLTDQLTDIKDTPDLLELWTPGSQDESGGEPPRQLNGNAVPNTDINALYRQMELKLESVVEMLLLSKVDENDNILASMQGVMERIFVTSAIRMTQGNVSRAAKLLGINRNTLSKKLKTIEPGG